ncbi:MAG: AbrB/MazE/SpoVT family DNA-binding domain-containing protein [Mucilaginibacter sp.]
MQSTIRNIGNSKGVIIPQNILKQCFIKDDITIEVKDNKIIISPAHEQKRAGWAEAFKEMAKNGDDELIIPDVLEGDDTQDWTWK